jgi:putative membrane protein
MAHVTFFARAIRMRRTGLLQTAAAITILALWGCSRAESTKTPASEPATGTPPAVGTGGAGANLKSDPDFVRDVALKGMAEMELSRLALGRTADADVRAFAQMMLDDHASAESALKTIVSGQGIDWPAQLDDKHKKAAGELAAKQGREFDREYMDAMIDGHQDLAAKLESRLDVQSVADWKTAAAARTESKAMPDPKVALRDVAVRPAASDNGLTAKINRWAADTYPVAHKHLDSASTLENTVKKRSTH